VAPEGRRGGPAARLGIDAEAGRTVERWNAQVREGKDATSARACTSWMGDRRHPNLGTVEQAPFYALRIDAHSAGTKGGPRTNTRGQVLDVRGNVIAGLYAAGNVMAGVSGPGYFGGGGTIGLAMTWGYLSGINAANDAKANAG
jgi:predicted oxidoreductase